MKLKKLAKMKNKILVIISSIITIYAIIGFIAVPKIAKPQIQKALEENLTQKASLGKIEFNPFLLKFTLHDFKIFNEQQTTISLDKLYVDFALFRSFDETHIAFRDLQLVNPYIHIIENEDGTLNLQKLVKEKPKKAEEVKKEDKESSVKFQIYRTILDNAKIKFTKLSANEKPYNINIDKLNYTFYDIGTYRNILASHSLKILINKHTELDINGGMRLAPFKMYGNVKLSNLKPSEFLTYKKDILDFDLDEKATVDLNFGYKVDASKSLSMIINDANLNLRDFDIKQKEKSLLSLKDLSVEQLNIFYPQNQVNIKNVALDSLNSEIVSDKNGVINLTTLVKQEQVKEETVKEVEKKEEVKEVLETKETEDSKEQIVEDTTTKEEPVQVEAKQTNPWKVNLEKFTLKNSNVNFKDLAKALFVDTKDINIDLSNLKVVGSDVMVENINLYKPTISLKDNKNKLSILNKSLEAKISNFSLKDSIINLEKINVKNGGLDFKDLKNSMQVFTKPTNIDVQSISKNKEEISISDISLNNPSILFNDNKNKMKVITNKLAVNLKELKLNGSDLNLKSANVKSPSLKFNDKKNKTDITVKNINLTALNNSLIKENLKVASLSLAKPTIYLLDNKTNKTIVADRLSLKLNGISKNKKGVYVSKINLHEPSLRLKDKVSKTDVNAKNINIFINKVSHVNNRLKVVSTNINKPYIAITLGKKPKVDKKEEKVVETKPKKKVKKSKNSFAFDIGPVKIKNMKMTFEDKNLPIPFKTNITKMNGEFSRLNSSSSKPTKLKLEGAVDKYGYTKITGTVDINDIKLLTDTNLLFKNIAIKNFTPYSGKFVGREIESGKLNLDLKYNIKKSDLNAQNSIVISDIKLGKKVDSPDAANLPLELAIALLEDSNGVIDLELPVSGNVDDPKFSIAPIVWKVFTNLIVKAITSPFSLLASVFGIAEEDIKSLEFEFGKSDILVSEKESLDNIAKILAKKPKLAIKIKPAYHKIKDTIALQDIKFEQQLVKQMKKVPEGDEYKKTLEALYVKDKKAKKLDEVQKTFIIKNKEGKEELDIESYVEHLRKFLASKQTVSKKELETLASNRVKTISNYLVKEKKISKEAIKIEDTNVQDKDKSKWVIFDLDVGTR